MPIAKEDCFNHISKRMPAYINPITALPKLVATSKVQVESLGGRGRLAKMKIKKI